MSPPMKDEITQQVMQRIKAEKIKMRPRIYFVMGSIFGVLGLTTAFISSAFMLSIFHLSLREGGRMHAYKLETLQEMFHWWIPVLAIVGLVTGIWLLRRYEFSYRTNFIWVALFFTLSVIFASATFLYSGAYGAILERGPMHGLVKPWQSEGYGQGQRQHSSTPDKGKCFDFLRR